MRVTWFAPYNSAVTGRQRNYAIAAAVLACLACVAWWITPAVDVGVYKAGPPPVRWAAWQRQEKLWAAEGVRRQIRHSFVPLERISSELEVAVLVSEDLGFFAHSGIDASAVWEAVREWLRGQRLRGASTITQQLARTLYLSNDRSWVRKVKEARLAFQLERGLGKRRVLELYLNVVEFGPGVYGAEAAARHYYGVGAGTLSPEQAAGLAAAVPSPALDNPATRSRRWQARTAIISRRMMRVDWLRDLLEPLNATPLVKSREGL